MKRRAPAGRRSWAAALLWLIGCTEIIDVQSDSLPVIEAVQGACDCPLLGAQGEDFTTACNEAVTGLADDELLDAAKLDCSDCANLDACYPAITGARENGSACDGNAQCASWGCCLPTITVGTTDSGVTLTTAAGEQAECCAQCSGCLTAFQVYGDTGELPTLCTDALAPAEVLADCMTTFLTDQLELPLEQRICNVCYFPNQTPECVKCLLDAAEPRTGHDSLLCREDYLSCADAPDRPIEGQGD